MLKLICNNLTMEELLKIFLNDPENQNKVIRRINKDMATCDASKCRNCAESLIIEGNPSKCFSCAKSLTNEGIQLANTIEWEVLCKRYKCFAKSIAHAPAGSQVMDASYYCLAGTLAGLGKISQCLQAIDRCFNSISYYTDNTKFQLYLRKIDCLKTLNEPLKAKEVYDQALAWIETKTKQDEWKKKLDQCYDMQVKIQLQFTNEEIDKIWKRFSIKTFNEEIPGASDAIGLQYSESQGRHYVAERDIKPGEILLKDRPYAVVCSIKSRYECCWHCCRSSIYCIPCDCCEQVIFCSEKCKEEAWDEYHHLECKVLPYFCTWSTDNELPDIYVAALRCLLLAIKEFGSVQAMRKAVNEMEVTKDPRTEGFVDGKLVVDKYVGFMNLEPFPESLDDEVLVDLAAVVYQLARTTTILGKNVPDSTELFKDEDFIFATCAFLRHTEIVGPNRTNVEKDFSWSAYSEMTCLSIPASFFNHSCVPNAFVVQTKDYSKVVAFRPIKKGDQVFLDYLNEELYSERREKRIDLREFYNLRCKCFACMRDLPLGLYLPANYGLQSGNVGSLLSITEGTKKQREAALAMDTKHDENLRKRYRSMEDIVKKLSVTIEKLDQKVRQPCLEVYQEHMLFITFFRKLHSAFM